MPIVPLYKLSRKLKLDWHFMKALLPEKYIKQIFNLEASK